MQKILEHTLHRNVEATIAKSARMKIHVSNGAKDDHFSCNMEIDNSDYLQSG